MILPHALNKIIKAILISKKKAKYIKHFISTYLDSCYDLFFKAWWKPLLRKLIHH